MGSGITAAVEATDYFESPGEEQAQPWNRKQLYWSILSLLVVMVSILALRDSAWPLVAAAFRPLPIASVGNAFALLLAAGAALIIHEAGHLLAALVCRFEISGISLGVFRFTRMGSARWRVQLRRHPFSGSVAAIPITNERWRARMIAVVAAGPLATFVSMVLLGLVLDSTTQYPSVRRVFITALLQVSFVIFLLGLYPHAFAKSAHSDASLLLLLWRDGDEANGIFLYHLVLQQQRSGVAPENFPLWLVELMTSYQGPAEFMALYAGILASWDFHRSDFRQGELWDQRALQLASKGRTATRIRV